MWVVKLDVRRGPLIERSFLIRWKNIFCGKRHFRASPRPIFLEALFVVNDARTISGIAVHCRWEKTVPKNKNPVACQNIFFGVCHNRPFSRPLTIEGLIKVLSGVCASELNAPARLSQLGIFATFPDEGNPSLVRVVKPFSRRTVSE